METQAQPSEGAHVTEEAGKGRSIQVHPLGMDAPFLRSLHGPEEVHAHDFEQKVEAHSEGGEEDCGEEVLV